MRRPDRTAIVVIAVAVAGLATTGSLLARNHPGPPPEALPAAAAFRPGTCRVLAEPVLAIARLDRTLATADAALPAGRATLADEQRKLIAARPMTEPGLRGPLDALVTSIGFVRLRADSHSYAPAVWREADTRRRVVQQLCVGHG